MMKNRGKLAIATTMAVVLTGAAVAQTDFTRYVSLGDSLTAGFDSGSLVQTNQATSYPALLARQGGSTDFQQPLVTEPGIPGQLQLVNLSPLLIAPKPGRGNPANLTLPRPYNNMAVPGADVADLVATVTDGGGLHDLILRLQGFTQLQQGLSLRPTFVTLWIGNNDVLGAATSGRVIDDVTLTTLAQFEPRFRTAVTAIAQITGGKFAVANIPDVASIPFVNTVPRFVVNPANGQQLPLIGPNGPLGAGDFVLLTATAELAVGRGIPGSGQPPLSDAVTLLAGEVAAIRARTQALNAVIRSASEAAGAAFVDAAAVFADVAAHGVPVGGITYTPAFLTGGIFSYDGVHPTAFGYAFIANQFIDAINTKYNDDIAPVDLYPFVFGASTTTAASVHNVSGAAFDWRAIQPEFIFTAEAAASLRKGLGVPTDKEIDKILRRRRRQGRG
jgi:lysophospholipase L1-like esterase